MSQPSPRVFPVLLLWGFGVVLAHRLGAGLHGALGTDATLWGLTALDLGRVSAPLVPPGYPLMIRVLVELGVPLVSAGVCLSLLFGALLPACVWWAARQWGAHPAAAFCAAVVVVLAPDVAAWTQQLQPDVLTALGLVVVFGLLGKNDQMPQRHKVIITLAVLAGLFPLIRSHGVVVAVVLSIVLALRSAGRMRLLAPAVVLGTWWLSPLLVGMWPGAHPFDVSWMDRPGGALRALWTEDVSQVPFVRELRRPDRQEYLALVTGGDVFGRLIWHLRRSWLLAWDLWIWVAGAVTVIAIGGRSKRLVEPLALLLCVAPALLIWSQRRHVAVALPLAFVVLAIGLSAMGRRGRLSVGALAVGLMASWPGTWGKMVEGERSETVRASHFAEVGQALAERAQTDELLGGFIQDVGLYHPMPRHDPDETAADWRTWWVTDGPVPPSALGTWETVWKGDGPLQILRLDPDRVDRPCAQGVLSPGQPHLVVGRAHANIDCPAGHDEPAGGDQY